MGLALLVLDQVHHLLGQAARRTTADRERNDSATFCAFLDAVDETVDPDLAIEVFWDKGPSHVSKETKAGFAVHPRWVVHHTPPHAGWVNQIQLFCIIQRKVIRNGSFEDETAKPFAWTYSGDPLKVAS